MNMKYECSDSSKYLKLYNAFHVAKSQAFHLTTVTLSSFSGMSRLKFVAQKHFLKPSHSVQFVLILRNLLDDLTRQYYIDLPSYNFKILTCAFSWRLPIN